MFPEVGSVPHRSSTAPQKVRLGPTVDDLICPTGEEKNKSHQRVISRLVISPVSLHGGHRDVERSFVSDGLGLVRPAPVHNSGSQSRELFSEFVLDWKTKRVVRKQNRSE